MKKEYKIGDYRTFEKYLGRWYIIDFIKNKNIELELILKPIKCKNCGAIIGDKKLYTFNYIEVLQEGNRILHLGISDCGRYIILEEYLNKEEIENVVF